MPDLTNKVALITGASRGIGAAVAKKYASLGADVILVARTVGGLEEVDDAIKADGNGKATLVPLDLFKLDNIDHLATTVAERFGKLDILVGNAGMLGSLSPITHVTNKVWDKVMTLNVTANWRLLRAFDPLLRKSDAGRALFVTSGVTKSVFPYWGPYAISKVALEMMVKTYAEEVAKTNIKAHLIDPGVVGTNMRAEAFPGEDPESLPNPEEIVDRFVEPVI